MFEDSAVLRDPGPTLKELRKLGVDQIRLSAVWLNFAPQPNSHRRPPHFRASDPAAYGGAWAALDNAVREAHNDGIAINLHVSGGAPLWATGPGAPGGKRHPNWMPNASDFGAFVRAVAERYSGNYNPATRRLDPGSPDDLPAARFWSIWNEPDYGPSLAPQGLPGNLTVEHSPWMYRQLVDAAWVALQATGHRRDTILIGEIAPRGENTWGVFSGMKPLRFVRMLYCVDDAYRPLRGRAASLRGCPTNAAGSRRFRSQHPALFSASGFADHPYSRWHPPDVETPNDSQYTSLADIGQLTRALDRVQRVYGSGARLPVWNTEYGYLTAPPKHSTRRIPVISPDTAAAYLNQAEYISWRNPRIMSFMNYLLTDPGRPTAFNSWGGFASGLKTWNGRLKPTYSAWRLPLYLPVTSMRRGRNLEVWGCLRPAFFALQDVPGEPERVQIQFAPGNTSNFTTVKTIDVTDPKGYFDTHALFPARSGSVRLTWVYPADDPQLPAGYRIYSRHVAITLR